jgi:hypothetical protein
VTIAPPTLADVLATLTDSLAMLPITAAPNIRMLPAFTRTVTATNVNPTNGGCFNNVGDLKAGVAGAQNADGNRTDVVYVGLYANGIPNLFGGCGGGNLAVTEMGFPGVFIHELGHALGRAHAPCGAVGTSADPNYPAFEPYDAEAAKMGVIGEFGLDIRDGTIHPASPLAMGDPQETDFMGYCPTQWVSRYGYLHANSSLPGLAGSPPSSAGGAGGFGSRPTDTPRAMTWMSGVIENGKECIVERVARVELHSLPDSRALPFVAEMLSVRGERIGITSLLTNRQLGCGCGDGSVASDAGDDLRVRFDAYLPVAPQAARLRIRKGDDVLWERTRPKARPRVELTRSTVGRDGDLHLRWQSNVEASENREAWVQWRHDRTAQWYALCIDVRENEANIPLDTLPAGPVRVRVLLHDGFFTASDESGVLKIPPRTPSVGIIHPLNDSAVKAGGPMMLWGYASDSSRDDLPDEAFIWRLNGKVIGTGRTLPVVVPLKGSRHTITLDVKNERGSSSATSRVSVAGERSRKR